MSALAALEGQARLRLIRRMEQAVERLLAVLNALDGDCDLEPDADAEPDDAA